MGLSTPEIFKALDLSRRSTADPRELLARLGSEGATQVGLRACSAVQNSRVCRGASQLRGRPSSCPKMRGQPNGRSTALRDPLSRTCAVLWRLRELILNHVEQHLQHSPSCDACGLSTMLNLEFGWDAWRMPLWIIVGVSAALTLLNLLIVRAGADCQRFGAAGI